jgi:hypothetical protein
VDLYNDTAGNSVSVSSATSTCSAGLALIGAGGDGKTTLRYEHWYAAVTSGGSCSITLNYSGSPASTVQYRGAVVHVISNSSGPQTGASTHAEEHTSGTVPTNPSLSVTPSAQPGLVLHSFAATTAYTDGTNSDSGWTTRGTRLGGTNAAAYVLKDMRISSTSQVTGLWTATYSSNDEYMVIFNDP